MTGEVTEVDTGSGLFANEETEGYLKVADIAAIVLRMLVRFSMLGDKVEAKIVAADRKTRSIGLY